MSEQNKTLRKYAPELGLMKESGIGQYIKLFDYQTLQGELELLKKQRAYWKCCSLQGEVGSKESEPK